MALFTRNNAPATPEGIPLGPKPISPAAAQMISPPPVAPANPAPPRPAINMIVSSERQTYFQQLKVKIHQKLVERLDMQNLRSMPPETVRGEVRALIRDLCHQRHRSGTPHG
jgi:hypothetical protein